MFNTPVPSTTDTRDDQENSVWILEQFAPELALMIQHAPDDITLTRLMTRAQAALRALSAQRYQELRHPDALARVAAQMEDYGA